MILGIRPEIHPFSRIGFDRCRHIVRKKRTWPPVCIKRVKMRMPAGRLAFAGQPVSSGDRLPRAVGVRLRQGQFIYV